MPTDANNLSPALQPEPLMPAQQRAARAEQLARHRMERALALSSHTLAQPAPTHVPGVRQPAGCRFDETQIPRTPVTVTPEARALLSRLHHEARILPQALEECCGEHTADGLLALIEVVVDRDGQLAVHLIHPDPVAVPSHHVTRLDPAVIGKHYGYGGEAMNHVPPTPSHPAGLPAFHAAAFASELARTYRTWLREQYTIA